MEKDISSAKVPKGAARLWWLCGAGFAFKTAGGRVIFVDPYLSDAVERLHGFKRLSLAPIAAEKAKVDCVVISHEHTDHLDPDALPMIARKNPACRFVAPAGCCEGLAKAGISEKRQTIVAPNRKYDLGDLALHTAQADHGDYAPTALSYLLDFGKVRVLYTGDTALRPNALKPLYDLQPDVLLPCINGMFGNMNHHDAVMMIQQCKPRVAIPHHFWLFAEQGGDPLAFMDACKSRCLDVQAVLLKPGEGFTCEAKQR
jgi:L-ascorbate 6-phosphate lactonase